MRSPAEPSSSAPPVSRPPSAGVLHPVVLAFVLSILAFGLLALAMSWPVQLAMGVPFALVAYVLARRARDARRVAVSMLAGAAPLGLLFAQFRNAEGSHLMPVLVVLSWAGGIVVGAVLAARRQGRAQAGW